jgi:Tol biopolymer transport system component
MMIDFTRDDFAPLRLTNTPHATEYIPQWHPSLPSLIFIRSQKSRGQDLVVIDNVRDPSARDLTNWSKDEIRPSWSPDGTKVAFYSNQKSSKDQVFDLWVINADGSNPKRLVKDVVVDEHQGPAWTDNSKNILYVKRDFDRANPIRWVNVINRRGGLITQETQLNSDLSAHYGDDGVTYLAYYARGHVNSEDKSWKRIFVVSFRTSDLR